MTRIAGVVLALALSVSCNSAPPPAGPQPTDLVAVSPSDTVPRVDLIQWTTTLTPASYRVTVLDAGGQTVLDRETTEQRLILTNAEMVAIKPGGYSWSVEARDEKGEVIATSRWQLFDVN